MTGAGERRGRGFRRTAALIEQPVKAASETRGFAVARLLTHWAEVAGDLARMARPVDVSYGREGFGATLTVLVRGADAPVVEMQKEQLRSRVNACYGYAAILRIRITQTSATGFAEPAASFTPAPERAAPAPETLRAARAQAQDIADPELRAALESLGAQVISAKTLRKR